MTIRKRFPPGALAPLLQRHGFSEGRLRAWVRDDLRTQAYLAQRFASASLPSDTEVSAAYNRQRAEFEKAGQNFEQAAPIVRERLIAARRAELIADWLSELRRRTDVVHPRRNEIDPRLSRSAIAITSEEHPQQFAAVEQRVADHRGDGAAAHQIHHAPDRAEQRR